MHHAHYSIVALVGPTKADCLVLGSLSKHIVHMLVTIKSPYRLSRAGTHLYMTSVCLDDIVSPGQHNVVQVSVWMGSGAADGHKRPICAFFKSKFHVHEKR